MNLELHIRIAGLLQIALAAAHIPFIRLFRWREEAARLSLFNGQVFILHMVFLVLTLALFGTISVVAAPSLVEPSRLGALLGAALALFWSIRLLVQFLVYDPRLWLGHSGRTAIHVCISFLWVYFTTVYAAALVRQLSP